MHLLSHHIASKSAVVAKGVEKRDLSAREHASRAWNGSCETDYFRVTVLARERRILISPTRVKEKKNKRKYDVK